MNHQDTTYTRYPPAALAYTATTPASTKPLRPVAKLGGHQFTVPEAGQLDEAQQQPAAAQQLHRRLLIFFGLYALLLVALYALYAAYYFCFHQPSHNQHQTSSMDVAALPIKPGQVLDFSINQPQAAARQQQPPEDNERLENKLILLERYIELLASEVQGLNGRLREREKCDCHLSCSFNGTKFAEGSSWQSQCDVCTCQSGRIMCLPQKCPIVSCDEPVLIPGQCCPTCLRSCKYNNSLIKHGKKFSAARNKECRCHDGRIRCEMGQLKIVEPTSKGIPPQVPNTHNLNATTHNNTTSHQPDTS